MSFVHKTLRVCCILGLLSVSAGLGCQKHGVSTSHDGEGGDVQTMPVPLQSVYFEFDKYNIRSDAQQTLEQHAQWLKSNADVNIIIEGNTDERGTEEYNLALGERRAVAAKNYLSNLGISVDRMSTISYGESRPASLGHDETAWSQNRRDDFKGRR